MRTSFKPSRLLLLVVFAIAVAGNVSAAEKIKVLIVTGFDVGSHKWQESTKLVQGILNETGRFDIEVSEDKEVFASPTLGDYEAVVLSYGFWKESDPTDEAKAGLLSYAKNGGNVMSFWFRTG